jgi:hypothetical protein
MHYKTPFSHNGYMKSLEFYEYYITLFCLEKKQCYSNFEPCMAYDQSWLNNYLVKATIKEQHHFVTCSV